MKRTVRGFTLIEQIVAIALAGAASAVAVPAPVELQAGTAAMVLNQAGCQVTGQAAVPGKCMPVQRCDEVAELPLDGLPPGYRVPEAPLAAAGVGAACRLVRDRDGAEEAFVGLRAGR